MSSTVHIAGPVGYLSQSSSAVFFSKGSSTAGTFQQNDVQGTAAPVKKLQNALDLAFWGEDNRFPQNIEQQMAYCGIGKSALDWKARELYGNGIIPGKIVGLDEKTNAEIFKPLDRTTGKKIYSFLEQRSMFRFFLEYLQDWVWYTNVFPEIIFSKDGKSITNLIHQESCDSRFLNMNEEGKIEKVILSKLWGAAADQYAKFDPKKKMRGLIENAQNLTEIDNKYVKSIDCIDMYDAVNSAKIISDILKDKKGLKSAILPVNYPSVNKTYYQVPAWDGARLGGWVEIACKIPALLKALYNKAYKLKYHIEIPETYFENKYSYEVWSSKTDVEKLGARTELLKMMDDYLSGSDNAYKTFVSFFQINPIDKSEYGRIKFTLIDDKSNIDKELLTSSAADLQIIIAMGIHPSSIGAGTIGTGQLRSGGSDIREGSLIKTASLNLERNVLLEPLYLVRDYNREVGGMDEWAEDIVFRIRDTVLTTLDTGAGTKKVVS